MWEIIISVLSSSCIFFLALSVLRQRFKEPLAVQARMKNLFEKELNRQLAKEKQNKKKNKRLTLPSLKADISKRLETELSLGGIKLRAEEFLTIWILSAFLPAGIGLLLGLEQIAAIPLLLAGAALPYLCVRNSKAKRLRLFEQQFGDSLVIMGNCLRSGLSFQQSINSIALDMPEPISKEFGRLSKEVQLGVPLEKALENMIERLESKDLMMIVAAVLIQRQVGGNLSEILDGISGTIKERLKIKSSIKVLTASGRISGMIVGLMPVFIFLILLLINPSYIQSFFDTKLGIILLCIAGGLEVVGFLAVKKIVSIKF